MRSSAGGPRGVASSNASVRSTESLQIEKLDFKNPFIPPSDKDLLDIRREELQKRESLRVTRRSAPIWERNETPSTMARTRKLIEEIRAEVDPIALRKERETRGLISAATGALSRDRRTDKETLTDFLQKKREMFLTQMALDIKHNEIAKLDAIVNAKEHALRKTEAMLEEDAVRFDAFLKENDKSAHASLREAEEQAKLKAAKAMDLKRVKHQLGAVAAEKTKLQEILNDFEMYKDFLEALTPKEWIDSQLKQQEDIRKKRAEAAWQIKVSDWEKLRNEKLIELKAKAELDRRAALRAGNPLPPKLDLDAALDAALPPKPKLEDEPLPELSEAEKEIPMYFTTPDQLADIFSSLEESNLFLIQKCADVEQQLEELRVLHTECQNGIQQLNTSLQEQVEVLNAAINVERAKVAALTKKLGAKASGKKKTATSPDDNGSPTSDITQIVDTNASAQDAVEEDVSTTVLPITREKMVQIYNRCGLKATSSSDILSMLTGIEGKLEYLLAKLSSLDPEYVVMKGRERERERRIRVKEARLKAASEAHEARQIRMLERAQAPVAKREGKPIMYRSLLPKVTREVKIIDEDAERAKEEARFFS